MRPPKSDTSSIELFRSSLEAILDREHELLRLAKLIDWERFDEAFGRFYHERKGRRGLPTR
jgi:IS5 family transposase